MRESDVNRMIDMAQNSLIKPTIKEVEEYMAALNIPDEQRFTQGLNGMSHKDLPFQVYTTPLSEDFDVVSKPKHYMLFDKDAVTGFAYMNGGIEVRDVIEQLVGKLELTSMGHSYMFAADYVQLMQYLMRFMDKNGKEDLEKARWYLDKMISSY